MAHTGQRTRAFTLTELLVVVCVILILLSILVVGAGGVYTYAMRLKCQHRMEQIWHACQAYANDHRGLLPASWDFAADRPWYQTLATENYLTDENVLLCPSSDLTISLGSSEPGDPGEPEAQLPDDVEAVQDAIRDALLYLKSKQDPSDGHWNGSWGYWGYGYRQEVAITGVAVLAYLGNGITVDDPEFGPSLEDGIRYLMYRTYTSPRFGEFNQFWYLYDTPGKHFNYDQGIAVIALCDALRMNPGLELELPPSGTSVKLQDMAERTFRHLADVQLGYDHGGFNYHVGGQWHWAWHDVYNRGDTSISGWCWQGMDAARKSGLTPAVKTWDTIDTYHSNYLRLLVPDDGTPGGGIYYPQSPYWFHRDGHYGSASWSGARVMTAISLADRLVAGYELDEAAAPGTIERDGYEQYQWLTAGDMHKQHVTGEDDGNDPDYYFLYYVTMAMNALRDSEWDGWINLVTDEFINHWQIQTGDEKGMFPNPGMYGGVSYADPDCVPATALAAMILEMCITDAITGDRWGGGGTVGVSTPGQYPYGYNKLVANEDYRLRKPAADTVILMDYTHDAIDADTDTPDDIAPRHGGKANVLFADGRVKAMTIDELVDPATDKIKAGMMTLEPGD